MPPPPPTTQCAPPPRNRRIFTMNGIQWQEGENECDLYKAKVTSRDYKTIQISLYLSSLISFLYLNMITANSYSIWRAQSTRWKVSYQSNWRIETNETIPVWTGSYFFISMSLCICIYSIILIIKHSLTHMTCHDNNARREAQKHEANRFL